MNSQLASFSELIGSEDMGRNQIFRQDLFYVFSHVFFGDHVSELVVPMSRPLFLALVLLSVTQVLLPYAFEDGVGVMFHGDDTREESNLCVINHGFVNGRFDLAVQIKMVIYQI